MVASVLGHQSTLLLIAACLLVSAPLPALADVSKQMAIPSGSWDMVETSMCFGSVIIVPASSSSSSSSSIAKISANSQDALDAIKISMSVSKNTLLISDSLSKSDTSNTKIGISVTIAWNNNAGILKLAQLSAQGDMYVDPSVPVYEVANTAQGILNAGYVTSNIKVFAQGSVNVKTWGGSNCFASLTAQGNAIVSTVSTGLESLKIENSGQGNLKVVNSGGSASKLTITSSGQGNIVLCNVNSQTATVSLSSSGNVYCNVQGNLQKDISGSGQIIPGSQNCPAGSAQWAAAPSTIPVEEYKDASMSCNGGTVVVHSSSSVLLISSRVLVALGILFGAYIAYLA